jgi:hypothetical protein
MYFSGRLKRLVLHGTASYREIHFSLVGNRNMLASKLPHQVIESTPEIVEHVSCNQGNIRLGFPDAAKIIDSLSRLRVTLDVDAIGVRLLKPITLDLEITDVLTGPYDLCH